MKPTPSPNTVKFILRIAIMRNLRSIESRAASPQSTHFNI